MDIRISVKSSTFSRETGHDGAEFECVGKLETKNGNRYIRYTEPKGENDTEAKVTLKLDGNAVTLIRSGDAKSHFVFEKGKTHLSKYITPYGGFLIKVLAHRIKIENNERGGMVDLGYTLIINDNSPLENNFKLTYYKI